MIASLLHLWSPKHRRKQSVCSWARRLTAGEPIGLVPTLVVLMVLSALPEITARLLEHGADPDTPAAVIASGTLPTQRTVVATLATLADRVAEEGFEPPATVVVGEVVRVRELLSAEATGLTHPARRLVSQV